MANQKKMYIFQGLAYIIYLNLYAVNLVNILIRTNKMNVYINDVIKNFTLAIIVFFIVSCGDGKKTGTDLFNHNFMNFKV